MTASLNRRNHTGALARLAVRLVEDVSSLGVKDAAKIVGISDTTAYVAWHRAHPDRMPGRRKPIDRNASIERFADFCDVVLECLVDGMTGRDWQAAVRDRYGSLAWRRPTAAAEERRFWRAVHRLVMTGLAERHGKRCSDAAYYTRRPA